MNEEFVKWLERKRYMHWKITPDGRHVWVIYWNGAWKWKQIKDYEY